MCKSFATIAYNHADTCRCDRGHSKSWIGDAKSGGVWLKDLRRWSGSLRGERQASLSFDQSTWPTQILRQHLLILNPIRSRTFRSPRPTTTTSTTAITTQWQQNARKRAASPSVSTKDTYEPSSFTSARLTSWRIFKSCSFCNAIEDGLNGLTHLFTM